ncbi:MAG: acetyl-CoA hydrolase/transferase C-terminal domain-containing protein [Crocinitomicaceae bacterium]|nr:acetyl-CoA hydrolase/transferase C-terminal domain-containing protein [Crocinitomicaceae bacterium]
MTSTAAEAVKHIKSGDNIFIHSAAAVPKCLVNAMTERHSELKSVSIYQIHTEGEAPYSNPDLQASFTIKSFFVGSNMRDVIQNGSGSYIPIFLSEVPALFKKGVIPIDVALITVSPPDKHGYCSLGTSVDISLAATQCAKIVIAQINDQMPRTHGDGLIHINEINIQVEESEPLPEVTYADLTDENWAIGKNICDLIEDGSTLQLGIGSIPNAVLSCLDSHKNIGIHSEMFSDGVLPLIEKGVINGACKKKHPGMIVSSFVVGSKKLYDFIDDNPMVQMLDFGYVNNVAVIQKNPKVVAINSAIEIDITGQVCADSIGSKIYSGVGGQMDFIRGASLSEGGKPIIALTSTTKSGISKIVPFLKQGAGVVTTRAHVHYVVTEYGVANLYGKTIEERVKLLIDIAHPAHREQLHESSKLILA